MSFNEKEVLNIDDAAEYLGVSRGTLYNWCSQRRVPFIKIGSRTMFRKRDLDTWIADHAVAAVNA